MGFSILPGLSLLDMATKVVFFRATDHQGNAPYAVDFLVLLNSDIEKQKQEVKYPTLVSLTIIDGRSSIVD